MELSQRLREATGPIHDRVEALPLATAMAQGTVDRDDYAGLLRRLLAVHRCWETEVAEQPACAAIWSPERARAVVLENDLIALGYEPLEEEHTSVGLWLAALRERAEVTPETWLGVIYLFEGSRMGSMALLRPLARGLGVAASPGTGLDYHLEGIADLVPRWKRTKATLDALPLGASAQQSAIWGASATFLMLHDLYEVPTVVLSGSAS